MSDREAGGAVTLDQLSALNVEIAALVRAGVPLDRGLIDAGRQIQGRLGSQALSLGERLGRGESLPEALGSSGLAVPELYRAVVEAGIRSGRLTQALEGMATLTRGHVEARRAIGLALLYPMMVVVLAYALFVGFVTRIVPRYTSAMSDFRLPEGGLTRFLALAGDHVLSWGPILPAILVILLLRWVVSGRARALDSGSIGNLAGRLPWVGRMLADFRSANFAELLALLLDHRVPLDEAVRLAAGASGSRGFREAGEAFADRLRLGAGTEPAGPAARAPFPPLIAWLLTAGHRQGNLPSAIRQASTTYRRKAESRSALFHSILPIVLMIVIGAGSVTLYGLMLFLPLRALWEDLALPSP